MLPSLAPAHSRPWLVNYLLEVPCKSDWVEPHRCAESHTSLTMVVAVLAARIVTFFVFVSVYSSVLRACAFGCLCPLCLEKVLLSSCRGPAMSGKGVGL